MKRRLLAAVAASAMIIAAVVPSTAMAAAPVRHFQRVPLAKIDPAFKPWLADPSHKVTAVLQLSDDPALAVPGLTKAQQRTKAGTLRANQGKLDGSIKADGGRVVGRYQYAYNGIKVQATGPQLTRLAALPGVVAVKPVRTYTRDNVNAIPYIQAPAAWQYNGATGAGETIALIDFGHRLHPC